MMLSLNVESSLQVVTTCVIIVRTSHFTSLVTLPTQVTILRPWTFLLLFLPIVRQLLVYA